MTYALTAIDYIVESHKPVVCLFARDTVSHDKQLFKCRGVIPYYYKRDDDRGTIPTIDGHKATRIDAELPSDVSQLRERHEFTYESDVLFPIRFLVDRGIRNGFDVKDGVVVPASPVGVYVLPLFLDVEVEVPDPNIFPEPREAKYMILSCHIWIPIEGNIAQYCFEIENEEQEKEFLEFFIEIVQGFDIDVFTAYNVFFDMGTIIGRMRHHKIDPHRLSPLGKVRIPDDYDEVMISGRNVFDYLPAYKKYKHRTLPSYSLKDIAEDECDLPAEEFPLERMNRNHVPEIAEYNSRDILRMQMLEWKLQIIPFYDSIRQVVGCTYDEVMEAAKYVDVFLLRYAKGRFVLPRKPKDAKRLPYTGAIVIKPEKGVHMYTILLDFSKMYPSILISYNISPETLRLAKPTQPHYTLPVGLKFKDEFGKPYVEWREVYFLKDPPGFLPLVAKDLIALRVSVQKEAFSFPRDSPEYELLWHRQDALKVVLDAMYGVFAYPKFRLFQPYISASMTGQGQQLAKRTVLYVDEQFNLQAIYGDSVTGDCPIITNRDGILDILPIEDLQPNTPVWTRSGWCIPKQILKKPCKKQLYEVISPAGIVKCTEDHSLFNDKQQEIKPQHIVEKKSRLEVKDYPPVSTQINCSQDIAWLLGLFAADGSGSRLNSTYGILTNNIEQVNQITSRLDRLDIKYRVADYRKSSAVYKIHIYSHPIWDLFDQTYSYNRHRKVPITILNTYPGAQLAFLEGYFAGDGHHPPAYKYQFVEATTKSLPLFVGISFLINKITGQTHHIKPHKTAYSIKFRSPHGHTWRQYPNNLVTHCRKISQTAFVYDIETDDSSFCIGQVVVHNTDGLYFPLKFTTFPILNKLFFPEDYCDGLRRILAIEIGEWVNSRVNKFWEDTKDEYGLYQAPKLKCEYVFESLMLAKKKRYSAMYIYDNGQACEPKLKIVGFETRRSDSADCSIELQKALFDKIHSFVKKNAIANYISEFAVIARQKPLKEIGIPLPLKTKITAMKNVARVKAIVYANQYLGQKIELGARPLEYYIKTERLKGEEKKAFGFRDRPILPPGLPLKFQLWTWSPKRQQFEWREYIADRVAFEKVPPAEWLPYIDLDTQIEKVVYNKVDTILNALGFTEEERIAIYGSKRPIKKEKEEEEEEEDVN